MKTIPYFAREILNRSATPALPLPRLRAASEEATAVRILAEIRSRPDLFRVLDPMIGGGRRPSQARSCRGAPIRGFLDSIPTPGRGHRYRLGRLRVFGVWEGGSMRIWQRPWHVGFF